MKSSVFCLWRGAACQNKSIIPEEAMAFMESGSYFHFPISGVILVQTHLDEVSDPYDTAPEQMNPNGRFILANAISILLKIW